jgi:hypothetical protein
MIQVAGSASGRQVVIKGCPFDVNPIVSGISTLIETCVKATRSGKC